jgi:hypothetical protein
MQVEKCINPEGYAIHHMILEVLHMKRFICDCIEDPHTHLDFFKEAYETFKLNAYYEDVVKYKLFFQTLLLTNLKIG